MCCFLTSASGLFFKQSTEITEHLSSSAATCGQSRGVGLWDGAPAKSSRGPGEGRGWASCHLEKQMLLDEG